MPRPAMRYGGRPVRRSPSIQAWPACVRTYPVITLTSVVLPAPLGPIRPWMEPLSTSSDTPSTALTPPKCRCRLSRRSSTGRSCSRPPTRPDDGEAAAADDPLRAEDDDEDQDHPADHVAVVEVGDADDLGESGEEEGAHHRPEDVAGPPEDREGQDLHRPRDAVLVGVHEKVQVRFQS